MVCKKCRAFNDGREKYCTICGGELVESTLDTSPINGTVMPTTYPTSGIPAFTGLGVSVTPGALGYASSVSQAGPRSDTFHN